MKRAHFTEPEMFRYKFRRDPKVWSIEKVHNLYVRALVRSKKMHEELIDSIHEIARVIPLSVDGYNKKCHITYFYREDVLYQYEMSYMKEYDSYGTSSNRVNFNEGNLENIRERKINFILNNENGKAFELGEKYDRLSHRSKNFHFNVKEVLVEMIRDELQKKYKAVKIFDIPKIIPVSINDRTYIFTLDRQSSGYYKKFELIDEMNIEPIIMK